MTEKPGGQKPGADPADIHEIQQVLYRYALAVDSREYDLLDECFTKDASFQMADAGTFTVEEYKELCRKVLPTLDVTQHVVSNAAIRVMGGRALSRSYFVAQHARNDLRPAPFLKIGGYYDDEFSKTAGGWRIAKRIGTSTWYDGNPQVLGYGEPSGALKWTAQHGCPGWMRWAGARLGLG